MRLVWFEEKVGTCPYPHYTCGYKLVNEEIEMASNFNKELLSPKAIRDAANAPWEEAEFKHKETVPVRTGWPYEDEPNKPTKETDPYGKQAGEPGSKVDSGKPPVTRGCLHYFPRALAAVAELSSHGAKKYSWKGWETVPDGINRYGDALGRHELAIEGDYTRRDRDTGVLEAVAVAWNALARLELILREQNK